MRIMAFDYGTKRIGIAVTDPMQLIATSLTTIHPKEIWAFLTDYLQKEEVETFVVGKPLQMDGTASQSTQHIVGFIRKLKKTYPAIPVVEIDERFTSKMAASVIAQSGLKKQKRQEKGLVDTVSATIILQTYMDSKAF
ncbi:Holliday junction resolvase RuvX [Sphingobacterium sp. DN00404]|uniref:Putative pre-16S rRNA nuclease n=1 Tax=Sphingobacterium micropteri TaxID=2763501 RepID=A0ABR7YT64_9SPHI|nr:Holliday junction resolvase RuvX [Sphingobacterium micropteri]MBD1434531.1 Holliday junction resolvase RuvX [Sphingobacterium micropteri]